MWLPEFNQEIVSLDNDEAPQPLGSEELRIDLPIVYRRGPVNNTTTSVLPPARWVSSQIAYGPKFVPDESSEHARRRDDCPFCFPGSDFLQDPRFQWCEAPWCNDTAHTPLADSVPSLYVGVHPAYYLRYHQVLFRRGEHDHIAVLKELLQKGSQYFQHFLTALRTRAQELAERALPLAAHTLIGGISFTLSWPHFHVNMGVIPSWIPGSYAYGKSYWETFSLEHLKSALRDEDGLYCRLAEPCRSLPRFPSMPNLVVDDNEASLWLAAYAGKSEHESVIFFTKRRALADLDDHEIESCSNALWTTLCYYRSLGSASDANGFLLAFHSQLRGDSQSSVDGGRLVFEITPLRKLGYLEVCHGCYILDDWPENTAARLRGFKKLKPTVP